MLLFLCGPRPLPGEEPPAEAAAFPYTLSVSSSAGLFYGQGNELVYKYPGGDTLLSQLLWDMKPLFYAGTGLELSRLRPLEGPGFLAKFSLRFGFPNETGIMEDRDWLNPREDFLTRYSRHTALTDSMVSLDLRLGLSLPLFSRMLLGFYLGIAGDHFKWTCRDGYIQYRINAAGQAVDSEPWDESLDKEDIVGPGIVYVQDWLSFFPGLSFGAPLGRGFSAELNAAVSPFAYGAAQDDHLLVRKWFYDSLQGEILGGLFLDFRGDLGFSPFPALELGVHAAFRYLKGQRGKSYLKRTNSADGRIYQSTEAAGGGYSYLDAGISVKIRL